MFKRFIKDPLFTFLCVGLAIFLLQALFNLEDDAYHVEVREADIARLVDQWSMQMRRPPSEQELQGLVEQFVKEEIYYREAMQQQLDQNDTIVRRRLVQKLTFLTEDIATAVPPTDEELAAFYEDHQEDYAVPERLSFKHRYFSSDRRATAEADATAALTDDTALGDPFMLQREYAERSQREIGDLFGRQFAAELFGLEPGDEWQGPVQSAYGWHALLISKKTPRRIPELAEVRERVLQDAKQQSRKAANAEYYETLKSRYSVSYPPAAPSQDATP